MLLCRENQFTPKKFKNQIICSKSSVSESFQNLGINFKAELNYSQLALTHS